MFCINCGAKNEDDVEFCSECGTNLKNGEVKSAPKGNEPDNNILYTLKPTFNFGYKFIAIFFNTLVYALLIGYICSEIIVALALYIPIIGLVCLLAILFVTFIRLLFENLEYSKLEYNFYRTKLEYKDGFLNKQEKTLKYKNVREVTMTQNIIERIFKIGKIRIFTNASSGVAYNNKNKNINGVVVHCIKNVNEEYKKVKELVDNENED
ncbi:MAG: PH domain-containing protein [Clostridia bacterium]|nr:PH domain-containing protein [Clostridia bacterium]